MLSRGPKFGGAIGLQKGHNNCAYNILITQSEIAHPSDAKLYGIQPISWRASLPSADWQAARSPFAGVIANCVCCFDQSWMSAKRKAALRRQSGTASAWAWRALPMCNLSERRRMSKKKGAICHPASQQKASACPSGEGWDELEFYVLPENAAKHRGARSIRQNPNRLQLRSVGRVRETQGGVEIYLYPSRTD